MRLFDLGTDPSPPAQDDRLVEGFGSHNAFIQCLNGETQAMTDKGWTLKQAKGIASHHSSTKGVFPMEKIQREHSLLQVLEAFTKGLTTLKEAIALVHSANNQLPAGESRQAIQQKIEEAERAIQLGHATMGQSLGFQLCHCTWPPQVMTSTKYSKETQVEQFTCPNCGKTLSLPGRQPPGSPVTAFDPYDVY